MEGAASQAGDADSSRTSGLNSGLQASVNVHRGALLLVPQVANGVGTQQQVKICKLKYYIPSLQSWNIVENDFK